MKVHAHKHDHCKHERLKFCAHCNKPHCLDCGEEWNTERIVYQALPLPAWPNYQQPYTWPTYICTSGGNADTSTSSHEVAGSTVFLTSCSHPN